MKKRIALALISSGIIFASAFGATSASWAVTDNADKFGVKIGINIPTIKHTITYYIPDISDQTFKNYTSASISVDEGTNLYTALNNYTGEVNGFNFVNWHESNQHLRTDDTTQDIVADSTTVTEDITVYGKFVKSNTFYYYDTTHHYVTSTTNDVTISTKTAYVGDYIYSLDGVEGHSRDLITDSGIYKLEKTTDNWNILRKVSFGIDSVSSWWTGNGAHTHIYYENTSGTGAFKTEVAFSSNKVTYYFNYDVNKFVVCRSPSNSTDWNQFWNQTIDTTLKTQSTGSTTYNKEHITLYVQDNKTDNKQNINWW